ncbi:hypothetical protein ACFLTC_01110, partial [Chloroflexota bacterium]
GGRGGGAYLSSSSEVAWSNGILWGNSAPSDPQINDQAGNVITLVDTLVEGGCLSGWKCEGRILTDDPHFFVDPDPGPDGVWGTSMDESEGDLRLQPESPAIDAGKNASVPLDFLDIDVDSDTTEPMPYDLLGNPRFVDIPTVVNTGSGTPPIVDMGAYETMVRIFLPLVASDW